MRLSRALLLAALSGALLALAAGCGGGDSQTLGPEDVPDNAVALVAGTPVLRTDFERFFAQAEKAAKARGEDFPQAGTPEYVDLQNQAVDYLITRIELEKEAESLGIKVTDADVDKRVQEIKDQFFQGDDKKYEQELKKLGLTDADVRADARAQLISEKLFAKVTGDIKVTTEQARTYYEQHKAEFAVPESREVAHILVDSKKKADELYAQLQDGADFAQLAREHSRDPGSAKNGGRLTDEKGSFVPAFEEVAFSLETGEIGKPVKSQYGWHIIKALADVKPGSQKPFAEVEDQIKEQLLRDRRNQAMTDWVEGVRAKYPHQLAYALGFGPASTTTTASP